MSDLVKRLRIKAGMIEMGERIAWGSDTALMREAADALEMAAPAAHQPCPESIREGTPYDDPAFEALCREHEIWGTAAAAQCAVFWRAGKRVAEQEPISAYACTVPDDCETLHWRGQILSLNELASVTQPAVDEEIHVNIEGGDVLTLPLAPSGMSAPRFVVHVPAQPAEQPDASVLVATLKSIEEWVMRYADPKHPVATVARKALAAYREGGEV